MPAGCKMVTDVNDACCKVPDCSGFSLGYTLEERARMQFGQKPGQQTQPKTGVIPSLPDTGMGTKPSGQKPSPNFINYPEQPTSVPGPIPDGFVPREMKPKRGNSKINKKESVLFDILRLSNE